MPGTEIRKKANEKRFHITVIFSRSSFPGYPFWLKITFITFIFLTHPFFHFSCYPPLSCSTTEKYNLQMNSSYHFLWFLVVVVLEGKSIASTKTGEY